MTEITIPWELKWRYGNGGRDRNYVTGEFGPIKIEAEYSSPTDSFDDDGPPLLPSWFGAMEYCDAGGQWHDRNLDLLSSYGALDFEHIEQQARMFARSLIEGGLLEVEGA